MQQNFWDPLTLFWTKSDSCQYLAAGKCGPRGWQIQASVI